MGFISGTTAAILGIAAAGAVTATSVLSNKAKKSSQAPAVQPVPEPKAAETLPAKAKETAQEAALKKRRARTKTVLTGPRGILKPATTETKSLLGS